MPTAETLPNLPDEAAFAYVVLLTKLGAEAAEELEAEVVYRRVTPAVQ